MTKLLKKLSKTQDYTEIAELMKHLLRIENKQFKNFREAIEFTQQKLTKEEQRNLLIEQEKLKEDHFTNLYHQKIIKLYDVNQKSEIDRLEMVDILKSNLIQEFSNKEF